MTTPAPAPVTTSSFAGIPWPPDIAARVISLIIGGAPLAGSFTRQPTSRSAVAWPLAAPTGFEWLDELDPFPVIDPGDDSVIVAVAKIGGIIDLSNESVRDAAVNITALLSDLLKDSLSRSLDLGLLNGSGPPEPVGILAAAPETAGADQLEAVLAAKGEIGDNGGTADTIAASGAWFASADNQRDSSAALVWPRGIADLSGLKPVTVPQLPVPLVFDSSRCFLIVNRDPQVDISTDWHFDRDATSVRVQARVAAAVPAPLKSIRKLAVTGYGSGGGDADAGDGGAARAARSRKSG